MRISPGTLCRCRSAGEAYVFYGSSERFAEEPDLSACDPALPSDTHVLVVSVNNFSEQWARVLVNGRLGFVHVNRLVPVQ